MNDYEFRLRVAGWIKCKADNLPEKGDIIRHKSMSGIKYTFYEYISTTGTIWEGSEHRKTYSHISNWYMKQQIGQINTITGKRRTR